MDPIRKQHARLLNAVRRAGIKREQQEFICRELGCDLAELWDCLSQAGRDASDDPTKLPDQTPLPPLDGWVQ